MHMAHRVPYSGKIWQGFCFGNLATDFAENAKLKPLNIAILRYAYAISIGCRQIKNLPICSADRFDKFNARQIFPPCGCTTADMFWSHDRNLRI